MDSEKKFEVILIGYDHYTREVVEQSGCTVAGVVRTESLREGEMEEWLSCKPEKERPEILDLRSPAVMMIPCYPAQSLTPVERRVLLTDNPQIFWGSCLKHPLSWVSQEALLGVGCIVGPLVKITADMGIENLEVL